MSMGAIPKVLPRPRVPSLPDWPTLRRRLLASLALAIALAAGYLFWLRDSSLVAVEEVSVVGIDSRPDIVATLEAEAARQTTLHVDRGALEAAVADEPLVRGLTVEADFPNALEIVVDRRDPVALLEPAGLLVAGDGVVLERGTKAAGVPVVELDAEGRPGAGERVAGDARTVATLLGAAPSAMLPEVSGVTIDPDFGIAAQLSAGIELRFGTPGKAKAKWLAAVAVLADPGLEGATYIDLSVPSRPVAGGGVEDPAEAGALGEAAPAASAGAATDPAAVGSVPDPVAEAPAATPVVPPSPTLE